MEYPRLCPFRHFTDYGLTPHDFIVPATSIYYRPWKWYTQAATKDFGSTIQQGKNNFKISLDVQHFRPEEISVKASEKEIIIEGKHEERQDDHGFVSRQFKRRYALPDSFYSDNVVSSLSSDGVLTVTAEKAIKGAERVVPIKLVDIGPKQTIKESQISTGIIHKDIDDTIKETNELIIKNKAHNLVKNEHSRLLKPEFLFETENGNTRLEHLNDLPSTSTENSSVFDVTSKNVDKSVDKQNIGSTSCAELGATNSSGLSACVKSEHQTMRTVSESIRQESSSYKTSTSKKSKQLSDVISAELREAADHI